MGFATASLLLPVFFAREFLGIDSKTSLKSVLGLGVYWSWALLSFAVFAGVLFHYLSAKWMRLAWDQPAHILWMKVNNSFVDRALDVCFWATVIAFFSGFGLTIWFFVTYVPRP